MLLLQTLIVVLEGFYSGRFGFVEEEHEDRGFTSENRFLSSPVTVGPLTYTPLLRV